MKCFPACARRCYVEVDLTAGMTTTLIGVKAISRHIRAGCIALRCLMKGYVAGELGRDCETYKQLVALNL